MPTKDLSDPQRVDFFISYTGADVAWAEWIASVLEDAGHTTILQARDFRPGSNFVVDMHDALRRSDRVMALLSKAYFSSAFGTAEWAEAFADDPSGHRGRLLTVRVGDCEPEGLLRAIVYVDVLGQNEDEARRRLLAGVDRGRAERDTPVAFPGAPRASRPFPGKLPAIWNVPARNPNFTGRDAQLDELRAALGGGGASVAVLAVSGLGGVGKTQLVLEHAWRRAADYDLVWWIPAEVPAAVPGALTRLAERLGVPTDEPEALVDLLYTELAGRERWMVLFDNAEDPASIGPYLPPAGDGRVLVTSRNPAWRSRGDTLDLDVWPRGEAVTFLLARTGSNDEAAARSISEELGLLPLALEQAGAYVEETGMALAAYQDLLASRRGGVLARGSPAFYGSTVATTFSLAYERAAELTPAAVAMLGTCAYMAPDDIPAELVATDDLLADEDALAVLRRLALVRRQGDSLAVHRLVGEVVRQRLSPNEAASRAAAAMFALRRHFPNPAEDHRSWPRSARLLPHVLALADHIAATAELGSLLNQAGIYLWSRAHLKPAQELFERALAIFEVVYGPGHPEVARALANLAMVLQTLGDRDGARNRLERALAIKEITYSSDDPEVAVTLANLGILLQELGDLTGAQERVMRALTIFEAAHGPDHPEVARTLVNLGTILNELGDSLGARERLERALRIKEAIYGADHAEVGLTLVALAGALHALGDLGREQEYLQRALAIVESAYGRDHPHLAMVLFNLGIVLKDVGNPRSAREHLRRAIAIFEAAYGPDHEAVSTTLDNLALVLRDLGDLAGAREHQQRALAILEAVYGPGHAKLAITLKNFGVVLHDLGDLAGARQNGERALAIFESAYGCDHLQVADTLYNLVLVLRDLGDLAGAREHQERALAILESAYGPDHPHTGRVRRALITS